MVSQSSCIFFFFFFNDTATTEIYTLSLHDALPIYRAEHADACRGPRRRGASEPTTEGGVERSEEHTSELQSRLHLVCRLLLEKKKQTQQRMLHHLRLSHVPSYMLVLLLLVGCTLSP